MLYITLYKMAKSLLITNRQRSLCGS